MQTVIGDLLYELEEEEEEEEVTAGLQRVQLRDTVKIGYVYGRDTLTGTCTSSYEAPLHIIKIQTFDISSGKPYQ